MSSLAAHERSALLMLTGDSSILSIAREIGEACDAIRTPGAVIGGIAVFLHGYRRTTVDVDAWCASPSALLEALRQRGFAWDAQKRELMKAGVPVHLLSTDDLGREPRYFEDREGVRTVSLGELLTLKLRTGVRNTKRAQDFADVVKLIEIRGLDESYSSRIAEDVRPEFRAIVRELSNG